MLPWVASWAKMPLRTVHQRGRISQATAKSDDVRLLGVLRAAMVGLVSAGVLALLCGFD